MSHIVLAECDTNGITIHYANGVTQHHTYDINGNSRTVVTARCSGGRNGRTRMAHRKGAKKGKA